MNSEEYKEKLNKHLNNNKKELYKICIKMVDELGREGGIIAYKRLSDYYEDNKNHNVKR